MAARAAPSSGMLTVPVAERLSTVSRPVLQSSANLDGGPDPRRLQDVPEEMKARASTETKGESSLRGHLKVQEGEEKTGSQSYVPPDSKDDKALKTAADLLHGIKSTAAVPAPATGDKASADKPATKAAN